MLCLCLVWGKRGQLRTAPLQQLGQALHHPAGLCRAGARAGAAEPGVDAQQDFGFGGGLHVVQRLRLLHQMAGQVFAQLVAFAQLLHRGAQTAPCIAAQGHEGVGDENLVVAVHVFSRV